MNLLLQHNHDHLVELLPLLSASKRAALALLQRAFVHNLKFGLLLKIDKLQLDMRATKSHSQKLGKKSFADPPAIQLKKPEI